MAWFYFPTQLGPQSRLRRYAEVPRHDPSVFEDQQGGDRGNVIAGGELLIAIDVNLANLVLFRECFNGRFHGPARWTPTGPKINQHGLAGLKHLLLPFEFF